MTDSLFLNLLSPEVRFQIFDELLNSHHTILISPNGKKRGLVKPLIQVCKQMRGEVKKWLKGKNEAHIIRSKAFGVLDEKHTIFKLCWIYDQHRCYTTLQRCYLPGQRDLEQLEMWQHAMDLEDTNRITAINIALRTRARFQRRKENYEDTKLKHLPNEDWYVLNPDWFDPANGPESCENLWLDVQSDLMNVWSDDFATHAEHQSYTRQHPMEEWRVRKVECGPAFEFRRDAEMNLIEA
jgi:hypothetical protein